MTEEILEAGPVQRGLSKEKLAETLSVGWHKFVAEERSDGNIGPMVISTRDWTQNRMLPQHSALAEACGLDPERCIGGAAKFQEDGSWLLSKLLTTTVRTISPEQFEEALRASDEEGYTTVSI